MELKTVGEQVLVFLEGHEEPLVPVMKTYIENIPRGPPKKTLCDIDNFLSPLAALEKILDEELNRPHREGNIRSCN